jgi:hypothetical protein
MNWSLVPLMLGSIALGWLGWWLVGVLGPVLGLIEPPTWFSLTGGLAFIVGAIGFLGTVWYVLRPQVQVAPGDTSYRADGWVRVIEAGGYAVSAAISRVQSGLLATYVLGSIVTVAIVLLVRVALR